MKFETRVRQLPRLGLGVSTEYGAPDAPGALDVLALRREHPAYAGFLEVGVDTLTGLDRQARTWADQGLPTTYHFLDLNLDEPEDFDAGWLDEPRDVASVLRPAWLCGDAGMWHFGGREPGQMLLLPPVLCDSSASVMAEGVARLRDSAGFEVFPENPPGAVFLGDLHLLDYFARVCERADTGMLLDGAHLAIYQHVYGHDPLTALDGFPLDRIVEMHVAGGTRKRSSGWEYIEDDHTPHVLDERKGRSARQRHRYYRKFRYPVDRFARVFCTGCGGCTRTFMASISLKETLNELIKESEDRVWKKWL